mmetsp:Transcript_63110/g.167329  ORF Transcript_63110/g.167329 Transcript_63110/m.167329 type:complete len:204 (+) Transcript_63110:585-1196(+)
MWSRGRLTLPFRRRARKNIAVHWALSLQLEKLVDRDPLSRDHELRIRFTCAALCLLLGCDQTHLHENAQDHLLQVKRVKVEARRTSLHATLAHLCSKLYAPGLERLIGGVRSFSGVHHAIRQPRLAQSGHSLQPAKTVETHDTGNDRNGDSILATDLHEIKVDLCIEEHLCDHTLAPSVDFLLEIRHFLVKVCVPTDGHDLNS